MKRRLEQQEERRPLVKIAKQGSPAAAALPRKRQPVIIHTYSPEVISVDVRDFMRLVQTLTGHNSEAGKKASPTVSEQQTDTQQSINSPEIDTSVLTEDVPDEAHSALCNESPDIDIGAEAGAIGNIDNNAVYSLASTTKLLPPFDKPPMFASQCAWYEEAFSYATSSWITEKPEAVSPSVCSPSFFDPSSSPSSFLNQLSPYARWINDYTNIF
ncbi:hypothetical protein KP509_33G035900 [Ceratopteris richardii]|uniref:VQ domain-containing protein n=1 Tax=Ceratopteris richardii TaxID=49495 RepID=A0A8T2QQ13_CERRI|nr:hypothetical protein KP509_33G035900 [Ceratopteris richardii]